MPKNPKLVTARPRSANRASSSTVLSIVVPVLLKQRLRQNAKRVDRKLSDYARLVLMDAVAKSSRRAVRAAR